MLWVTTIAPSKKSTKTGMICQGLGIGKFWIEFAIEEQRLVEGHTQYRVYDRIGAS
jgi:hypothetical protein